MTPRDVAIRAGTVFRADYDAAPRGHKTRAVDRLRHALTYVVTGGRVSSSRDCTTAELVRVWHALGLVERGALTYQTDETGITWRTPRGREARWSDPPKPDQTQELTA